MTREPGFPTRRARRDELRTLIRRGQEIHTPTLCERFGIKPQTLFRDLELIRRNWARDEAITSKVRLLQRIDQIATDAHASGDYGAAVRALETLCKIGGHLANGTAVNVTATAQADAAVTTFAELSKRAATEGERNRVADAMQDVDP